MSANDEPSIPMDQEEDDNEEYYSARESLRRKGSADSVKSVTPKRNSSPRITEDPSPKQQMYFSDEKACQEGIVARKSDKVRKMIEERNRWDMIDYKKEDLERPAKQKSKKKKKSKSSKKKAEEERKKKEKEEKSKTDEEGEDEGDEESLAPKSERVAGRELFKSDELILNCTTDVPIAPKCKFTLLRFAKTQEVVEYDEDGFQHLLNHYNERAISNPWRKWGAHKALCDQGGYVVGKNKKLIEIKRGSNPPPCPPNPRQVTLNKNAEAPDSQTMMGVIKVEPGPSEDEVHRIGKVIEEYVRNGGFVPRTLTKQEMAVAAKPRVKKTPRPKKKSSSSPAPTPAVVPPPTPSTTESQEGGTCEDESLAERIKGVMNESKRGIAFFKRKKNKPPPATGGNTRRSQNK